MFPGHLSDCYVFTSLLYRSRTLTLHFSVVVLIVNHTGLEVAAKATKVVFLTSDKKGQLITMQVKLKVKLEKPESNQYPGLCGNILEIQHVKRIALVTAFAL